MKKITFVSAVLVFLFACKKEDNPPLPDPVPAKKTVRYEIDCPNCFVVYYSHDEAQISSQNQSTGWFAELEVDKGFVALIAAHNQSGSPAAVTARIKVDGALLKTQTTYCPVSGVVLVTDTIK